MNSKEVFNFLMEKFEDNRIAYVILHSYQQLPERFDSDIDIAINVRKIEEAISLLDNLLKKTGWRVVQCWRHEYYAADCVISNDNEFLQVDFCTHYERNGRVVLSVNELISGRKKYNGFYVPSSVTEFTYILLKKILKKYFSDGSKIQLTSLLKNMSREDHKSLKKSLQRFLTEGKVDELLKRIRADEYDKIDVEDVNKELLKRTSAVFSNINYELFDFKRKIERIIHPTGVFVVLLGADGAGKSTIAEELKARSVVAYRNINHYHSRVRVLKDISQIKSGNVPVDATNPHGNKRKSGKLVSIIKFGYYFLDFLIGNIFITKARIKSSLVLVERYYYDYMIDKVRYNLNLSDGFIRFFGHFVKKPDVIFILTGDSHVLYERKHEITIEEIDDQKKKFDELFKNNPKAVFIDTTKKSVDECVDIMLKKNNEVMRGRRKWK